MVRARAGTILSCILLAATIVPVSAQMESREGIALQNQILELQREIQELSQRGGGAPYPAAPYPPRAAPLSEGTSDIVTQLLTRVDSLDSELRDLRGRVDELTNTAQQQNAQLGKQIGDLQFQLRNATPGVASGLATPGTTTGLLAPSAARAAPPRPPLAFSGPPGPVPAGPRASELTLSRGDVALARHDYTGAEQDARAVLANRASPHAYEAQYVLAQALMGQHQYSQAAIAYDDAYNRQKKGGHAADALLGLADSLTAINEKRAACDTLTKLHAEFPVARAGLRERAAQSARRAGCR